MPDNGLRNDPCRIKQRPQRAQLVTALEAPIVIVLDHSAAFIIAGLKRHLYFGRIKNVNPPPLAHLRIPQQPCPDLQVVPGEKEPRDGSRTRRGFRSVQLGSFASSTRGPPTSL